MHSDADNIGIEDNSTNKEDNSIRTVEVLFILNAIIHHTIHNFFVILFYNPRTWIVS